jgi:hypothetical protein
MKPVQVLERSVVFSDSDPDSPQRVACFPSLARLADGRVLCAFRVGSSKDSADETIRLAGSRDGAGWELLPFAPATSLDGVPGSLRVGHLIETAPGQLLVVASWVNRSDPAAPISHPETGGCLELRSVVFRSRDGGASWSEALPIADAPFPQPEISGPPVALSQPGHLLLPMENQKSFDDPNPIDEKAYALLSFDAGLSWPEWAMIAHDFPHRKFWCNRVAKLPSGRLACVSWTFDEATQRDLPLHLSFGSPDGRQWSAPVSTGIHGQVSHLLALDESTLLMATSHRESPAAIRLRASFDGGKSWDGDGLLVLDAQNQAASSGGDLGEYYQQMTGYTFGWSPMLRLDDDTLLLAYFAGGANAIGIYAARIALREKPAP